MVWFRVVLVAASALVVFGLGTLWFARTAFVSGRDAPVVGDLGLVPNASSLHVRVFDPCVHRYLAPLCGEAVRGPKLWGVVDKVFVGTTRALEERRRKMVERLGRVLPAGWERWNRVQFIDEFDKVTVGMVRCMSPHTCQFEGALGTSMSQYAAHYASVYWGLDVILVLEDDMNFKPSFGAHVQAVVRQLEDHPFATYVQADERDLLDPPTVRHVTPTEKWDQVMVSGCPFVSCPRASFNMSVCFMPHKRPTRCAGAVLFSRRGSAKVLQVPIQFQTDWQYDLVARTVPSYTGFWTAEIHSQEDHSDYKRRAVATWRKNQVRFHAECLKEFPEGTPLKSLPQPLPNCKSCG